MNTIFSTYVEVQPYLEKEFTLPYLAKELKVPHIIFKGVLKKYIKPLLSILKHFIKLIGLQKRYLILHLKMIPSTLLVLVLDLIQNLNSILHLKNIRV